MYSKILVPVALTHEGRAEAALKIAKTLRETGGQIRLLHVIEDIPGYATAYIPDDTIEKYRSRAMEDMRRLAAKVEDGADISIVHGHPSRAILDYAEQNDADCIVIASHMPGLEDYFLGSTAARVVRHAPCSVHVIR